MPTTGFVASALTRPRGQRVLLGQKAASRRAAPRRAVLALVAQAASDNDGIVIIGGGIGGLSAAAAIRATAPDVPLTVIERRPIHSSVGDLDAADEDDAERRLEGVSVALWPNAWRCLDALDKPTSDLLRRDKVLVTHGRIASSDGRTLQRWRFANAFFGSDPAASELRAVPRGELVTALAELARRRGAQIVGDTAVKSVDERSGRIVLTPSADAEQQRTDLTAAAIVAADGIGSRVRRSMFGDGEPTPNRIVAWRGVAPTGYPDDPPEAKQVWGLSSGVRFGSVPITAQSTYWFVTAPPRSSEQRSAAAERKSRVMPVDDALELVRGFMCGVEELVAGSGWCVRSPLADRLPRWQLGSGVVTLLGDAAHPMLPNLGQGAAAALEDAVALGAAFQGFSATSGHGSAEVQQRLRRYEAARRRRAALLQVRSRAASTVVHSRNPLITTLLPVLFQPKLVFSHCGFKPQVKI